MATIDGNQKKLTVSGELIESAVNSKHDHSNKTVLDKLTDNNGTLQYNGADITGGGSGSSYDDAEIKAEIAKKQDKLTAGSNITIASDGTISATGELSGTIGRYSFDNDLLESEIDNAFTCTATKESNSFFNIRFDLGKNVTNPTLTLEHCIAPNAVGTITKIEQVNTIYKNTTVYGGSTVIYASGTDGVNKANVVHSKEMSFTGTGRYGGFRIYFDGTSPNFDIKVFKLKYNGTPIKIDSVYYSGSSTTYTMVVKPFAEDRLINYGNYEEINQPNFNKKTIYGMGDSTTFGENGATAGKGIMYHIGRKFPQCNVINKGWNGVTSEGFYSTAIQVKDWTNVVCVLACYGWNDNGANGSLTGSIPQLTCKDLTTVITDGVTIEGAEIKTAEDYFALFNNDWYGRMAKAIEYIKFYNPMTQIILHTPHSSDEWQNHQTMCSNIAEAMKELGEYYAIPVIDCHSLLGISNRNSQVYRLDWAHLGDMGNEIKGSLLANSMEQYFLMPTTDDDCGYKSYVSALAFNRETETVTVDGTLYLYVKVTPYNSKNKNITYSTDNSNVTVTEDIIGLQWHRLKVTGVSTGDTVITATSDESGVTATCTVTVATEGDPVAVQSVSLDKSTVSVAVDDTATVKALLTPATATNKTVVFSIDNANATIRQNGLTCTVTGVTEGNSVITVTTDDGSYTATCDVTITAKGDNPVVDDMNVYTDYKDAGTVYSLVAGNMKVGRINQDTGVIDTSNTTYMNSDAISVTEGQYYVTSTDTSPNYIYAHFYNGSTYVSSTQIKDNGCVVPSGADTMYLIVTNGTYVITLYNVTDLVNQPLVTVGTSSQVKAVRGNWTSGSTVKYGDKNMTISPVLVVEPSTTYTISDYVFESGSTSAFTTYVRTFTNETDSNASGYLAVNNGTFTTNSDTRYVRIVINSVSASNLLASYTVTAS